MSHPVWPTDFTKHDKDILIRIMKDSGYGDPEYTNYGKLDYKFFEDADLTEVIFHLCRSVALLQETCNSLSNVIEHINNTVNDADALAIAFIKKQNPEREMKDFQGIAS